jgi:hypothetical protein
MRLRIPLLALVLLAAGALAAQASDGNRSTGNTTTHVVAGEKAPTAQAPSGAAGKAEAAKPAPPVEVKPQAAVRLELATGEKGKTLEGKTSESGPAEVLWAAPAKGEMLNVRVSSPANGARLSVYQPGAEKPEAGTAAKDGAIAWTGAIEKAGDLRIEVSTKSAAEIPFRVSVSVTPAEETQPKTPAKPAAPGKPAKPEKN